MPSKNTEQEKPIKKSAKRKTTTNSGTATKKTTKRTTKSGSGATKATKKPAATTVPVLTISPEERENSIRVAAYYSWEQRGRIHGFDIQDWIQAEKNEPG
ncbi:MAG: DUF2934 domain-containing protein [Chlorobium sp.]|nr:DUF2934 domain-containing protein [Chlorobium sp.]MCW8819042.1 DUF2934 domain-containing protein [Ignavibacteriaceae bacterium]